MLIELSSWYKDRDFGFFDLFLSALSAIFFLNTLYIVILSKRKPGDSLAHPLVFVMGLLTLVVLLSLAMIFFG
jgi:hypothetical protein